MTQKLILDFFIENNCVFDSKEERGNCFFCGGKSEKIFFVGKDVKFKCCDSCVKIIDELGFDTKPKVKPIKEENTGRRIMIKVTSHSSRAKCELCSVGDEEIVETKFVAGNFYHTFKYPESPI